ncbi:hypothetical protein ACFO5O_14940 [Geojedonia litorea]|uniref:STAS/SEC14 domain-containing protein n=1 Tax=Geojedonia litorea TaxID=1268269 RepID=A0ABV9N9E3_9FLAO
MIDIIKNQYSEIQIYDNYMIVTMNEGITVLPKHNQILINIVNRYFKKKSFVYITHRLNSYSVDPAIYFETSKIPNLLGFAIVSKNYKAKLNAEIEKLFFNKPFEIFNSMELAILWAKTITGTNQ